MNGCHEYDWREDFTEEEMSHFDRTGGFFVLVTRGGCAFSTKIKQAEKFGAEAIIVADFGQAEVFEGDTYQNKDTLESGIFQPHIPLFEINSEDSKKLY